MERIAFIGKACARAALIVHSNNEERLRAGPSSAFFSCLRIELGRDPTTDELTVFVAAYRKALDEALPSNGAAF